MSKSLQTTQSQSKYHRWLNDPDVQIEDFGNYVLINSKDNDNNLISQILTTIYDLNKIKPYLWINHWHHMNNWKSTKLDIALKCSIFMS